MRRMSFLYECSLKESGGTNIETSTIQRTTNAGDQSIQVGRISR